MSAIPARKLFANGKRQEEILTEVPLRVVYETSSAQRKRVWPFVAVAALLLIAAVVVPVVLNTQMAQRAYDIREQQLILNELERQQATLEQEILEVSSTQSLQEKAEEMGLVPAGVPGVISLEDSTVTGGVAAE